MDPQSNTPIVLPLRRHEMIFKVADFTLYCHHWHTYWSLMDSNTQITFIRDDLLRLSVIQIRRTAPSNLLVEQNSAEERTLASDDARDTPKEIRERVAMVGSSPTDVRKVGI